MINQKDESTNYSTIILKEHSKVHIFCTIQAKRSTVPMYP